MDAIQNWRNLSFSTCSFAFSSSVSDEGKKDGISVGSGEGEGDNLLRCGFDEVGSGRDVFFIAAGVSSSSSSESDEDEEEDEEDDDSDDS
jgi:hypothetical protein